MLQRMNFDTLFTLAVLTEYKIHKKEMIIVNNVSRNIMNTCKTYVTIYTSYDTETKVSGCNVAKNELPNFIYTCCSSWL